MSITFTFDGSEIEAGLRGLSDSLPAPFGEFTRQARSDMSRSVALNFRAQGRPSRWTALSAYTIARRRRMRPAPVAGVATPLRVTDTLRRAAEGQPGSKSTVAVDGYSASIEIDVDYAGYQNNGTKKIPARPYFFLQDSDVDQLYNRFSGEVNRRILKGWG